MPPLPPRLVPGTVKVWHASIADFTNRARIERALAWLEPEERDRHARFRGDDDRRMFLLGRLMARVLVGQHAGVAPDAWQWREGPHGRPEVAAPATPVRFNLAHSAGLVVCALATGRDVGVDVEDLARRPIEPALVRRYCCAAEIADIEARPADARHDRFLVYWTLKEAYLKARGLGISVPLAEICFTVDDDRAQVAFVHSLAGTDTRWAFHLTRPTGRHLVAVATPVVDGAQPRVEVAPFDV
jgi:4'-phosphopantetheinyl transferase